MGEKKEILFQEGTAKIVAMNSIAQMSDLESGHVVVAGSHGSSSAARHVARYMPFGCILNDAGIGKNNAGISGLSVLEAMGIAGATVDCMSARIGEGVDNYKSGVVSAVNDTAGRAGVLVGMPVRQAARRMIAAKNSLNRLLGPVIIHEDRNGRIILTDTIAYLGDRQRRSVVVGGSHCAHTTYDFVKDLELRGIFLNDAGKGKENAGISGLNRYQKASIPAGSIDCMTAMIGDSQDAWKNGIVSSANALAQQLGVTAGMPVREAAFKVLKTGG